MDVEDPRNRLHFIRRSEEDRDGTVDADGNLQMLVTPPSFAPSLFLHLPPPTKNNMAPLSKLEKFINLVGGEDKLPKKTYNPALTDEELAARAPDSTISPHGPVDDHSLDIFHGEPYNNTDLQLVEEAEGRFGELETKDDFRSQQPQPWCTVPLRPLPVKAANNASESQKTSQPVSPKIDLDGSFELDPRTGDPAPLGINFSPLLGIIRFPYKFVSKVYMQPIASQFFDQEKVWNRGWDL